MLNMRLEGRTYKHIATKAGITRQRVQQLLSPPKEVRDYVIKKYKGKCADCDIFVGKSAHIHHDNSNDENYNDIENLVCLCISCHRKRHRIPKSDKQKTTNKKIKNMKPEEIKKLRKSLNMSQSKFALRLGVDVFTVRRWEYGRFKPSPMALRNLEALRNVYEIS